MVLILQINERSKLLLITYLLIWDIHHNASISIRINRSNAYVQISTEQYALRALMTPKLVKSVSCSVCFIHDILIMA